MYRGLAPMAPKRKATEPAPAPAPAAPKPVNQRGKEWAAERLTGKRAQSGKLPGGGPRYTYEVVWKVTGGKKWANTWEPADCLIGWEAEMSEVDKKIVENAQQAPLRLAAQANAVREAAAKKKAAELADRRKRLLRKQQRQQARGETPSDDEGEEDGEADEEDDSDLPALADELAAALRENLEQLRQLGKDPTEQQKEPQTAGVRLIPQLLAALRKRRGRSRARLGCGWRSIGRLRGASSRIPRTAHASVMRHLAKARGRAATGSISTNGIAKNGLIFCRLARLRRRFR